jgi:hypothetical protein
VLIQAKQMPIQVFKVQKTGDKCAMPNPGPKKNHKLEGIGKVADVKKK